MSSPTYNPNAYLPVRIYQQAWFALTPSLPGHRQSNKNTLEKIGDVGLSVVEYIPTAWRKLKEYAQDPRVVTIAFTAFALYSVSLGFYPTITIDLTRAALTGAWQLILRIPYAQVKFATYIMTVGTIISAACRAEGRFFNKPLLDRFYGPTINVGQHLLSQINNQGTPSPTLQQLTNPLIPSGQAKLTQTRNSND